MSLIDKERGELCALREAIVALLKSLSEEDPIIKALSAKAGHATSKIAADDISVRLPVSDLVLRRHLTLLLEDAGF